MWNVKISCTPIPNSKFHIHHSRSKVALAIFDRVKRFVRSQEKLSVIEGDGGIAAFFVVHRVFGDFDILVARLEDACYGGLIG